MQLLRSLKNKIFLTSLLFWTVATFSYFIFVQQGLNLPPIAEDNFNLRNLNIRKKSEIKIN